LIKNCLLCNGEFNTTHKRVQHCSRACSYRSPELRKTRSFNAKKYNPLQYVTSQARRIGAIFRRPAPLKTRKNISISKMGNKNPNWKGGVSLLRDSIRACFKYRQWRSDIFTRDNFTCQQCGFRGLELNADHIVTFFNLMQKNEITTLDQAINCDELWNINNGRTLCVPCHKKTPTYGRRVNNDMLSLRA